MSSSQHPRVLVPHQLIGYVVGRCWVEEVKGRCWVEEVKGRCWVEEVKGRCWVEEVTDILDKKPVTEGKPTYKADGVFAIRGSANTKRP